MSICISDPLYVGSGGILEMNTQVGGDSSPTDVLIIDGGTATGTTTVRIINVGGVGATTVEGILVVQATNGATTDAAAFALETSPLPVNGHGYFLVRGKLDGSAPDNWYLRNLQPRPGPDPSATAIPVLSPAALVLLAGMLAILVFRRSRRG
ncbi:MAG: IPTL-CTERM sorting domain-containing protein [Burkholderiales bacterium]|nr:IPTL-CTERM sorting domain-containing protein [Burkholderiales bacterium]